MLNNIIDFLKPNAWVLWVLILEIVVYTIIEEEERPPILYFVALSVIPVLVVWWYCYYKYQPIQSPPKLKKNTVNAGGFTWISLESKGVPEIFRPKRKASGLMWEGFTTGISNENGKAGSIAVWLYGSNEGVGHYVYSIRTNTVRSVYGEGHFNLRPWISFSWETRVLQSACERIAEDVGRFYRPLSTSYDEKSKKIWWYDGESGRDVHFREKRTSPSDDLFFFGPYPKKRKNFVGYVETPRLLTTPVERAEKDSLERIIINAKDIYGQPLKHVYVEVKETESGYSYKQKLPSNGEFMPIIVPPTLQKLTIKVCRGGYGNLMEEVDVEVGDIKVEAILEPLGE